MPNKHSLLDAQHTQLVPNKYLMKNDEINTQTGRGNKT